MCVCKINPILKYVVSFFKARCIDKARQFDAVQALTKKPILLSQLNKPKTKTEAVYEHAFKTFSTVISDFKKC